MEPPTDRAREMKVRVPAQLATALHARKILTGQEIGKTVEAALRAYFATKDAQTPGAAPPLASLREASAMPVLVAEVKGC